MHQSLSNARKKKIKPKQILCIFILLGVFFSENLSTHEIHQPARKKGIKVILKELIQPRNIQVRGDKIYITDYPHVFMYSARDFKLLKKFGEEGQGPGEFYLPMELPDFKRKGLGLSFKDKRILIWSLGRISVFTPGGVFLKSIRFNPHGQGENLIPFMNGFIGSKPLRVGANKIFWTVNYYDARVKKVREICRYPFFLPVIKGKIHYFARNGLIYYGNQDRLFITNSGMADCIIDVYDLKGNKRYRIQQEMKKIKIPAGQIKKYREEFRFTFKRGLKEIMKRTVFPEFYPGVRHFYIANNRIYLMSYQKQGDNTCFLILDLRGNFLKQVKIPLREKNAKHFYPYCIDHLKFYQLVENQDEEWVLNIEDIR